VDRTLREDDRGTAHIVHSESHGRLTMFLRFGSWCATELFLFQGGRA